MKNTKFQPGQSGNPAGRPKDKTPSTKLRKTIVDDMPEIVKTLVELAKGGDVHAAKVLGAQNLSILAIALFDALLQIASPTSRIPTPFPSLALTSNKLTLAFDISFHWKASMV